MVVSRTGTLNSSCAPSSSLQPASSIPLPQQLAVFVFVLCGFGACPVFLQLFVCVYRASGNCGASFNVSDRHRFLIRAILSTRHPLSVYHRRLPALLMAPGTSNLE